MDQVQRFLEFAQNKRDHWLEIITTLQQILSTFFPSQVLGHRLILSFASSFLNELLILAGKDDSSETVVIVPDFSAYDISDFLMALYGGLLPENTSNFEQILDLFQISPLKHQKIVSGQQFETSPDSKIDVGQVFGQICSEIEQEFLPSIAASPSVSR